MKKVIVNLDEKLIIGIQVRTNNTLEAEPLKGRIFPCVRRYFHENLAARIPNRKTPGTTYCAYAEYETDHRGDYAYFIGEEVQSATHVPEGLQIFKIPAQKYAKFTNGPGSMPDVVKRPWEMIWNMSRKELGGERAFLADFEIYDERSRDHQNIVLDFYIGIK